MKNLFFVSLTPFISFFVFYFLIYDLYFNREMVTVPNFIEKNIKDVLIWSHKRNISIKIKNIFSNHNKEEGTVIAQYPSPGSLIKKNNIVYFSLVLYEKDSLINLNGIVRKNAKEKLEKKGIIFTEIPLFVPEYPEDIIVAYYYNEANHCTFYYTSLEKQNRIIIPSFIDKECSLVKDQNKEYNFSCYNKDCTKNELKEHKAIIEKQDPSPGTFIDNNSKEFSIILFH